MLDVPFLLERLGIRAERRGEKLEALCPHPDHNDRSPSWVMYDGGERHGAHKCLSCGFGGDAITLVRAVTGLGFRDALTFLTSSERAGAVLLDVQVVARPLMGPTTLPDGVVFAPLDEWPSTPRDYLKGRGVTALQVAQWRLGYATEGQIAGRILFPTVSADGKLIGWSARSYIGAKPKYKSASRHHKPHPGGIYGEQAWPPHTERQRLVVVEGQLDGLAIDRECGVPFGALRGSQLDPGQSRRLASWPEVLVLTDPDAAGMRVGQELQFVLGRHCDVQVRVLPAATDPADLAVQNAAALRAIVFAPWQAVERQ